MAFQSLFVWDPYKKMQPGEQELILLVRKAKNISEAKEEMIRLHSKLNGVREALRHLERRSNFAPDAPVPMRHELRVLTERTIIDEDVNETLTHLRSEQARLNAAIEAQHETRRIAVKEFTDLHPTGKEIPGLDLLLKSWDLPAAEVEYRRRPKKEDLKKGFLGGSNGIFTGGKDSSSTVLKSGA
eukprot:Polyplicarium_translucidae@DN3227_c0_g1_i13.p1